MLTRSGLDYIPVGEEVKEIPDGLLVAHWDVDAFKNPSEVVYKCADGSEVHCQLLDLELEVFRDRSGKDNILFAVRGEKLEYLVNYSLTADTLFLPAQNGQQEVKVMRGNQQIPLITYLNSRPLNFYFADFSVVHGFNVIRFDNDGFISFDPKYISVIDWDGANVDITVEYGVAPNGKLCIQDYIKQDLSACDADIVFYDHGKGEIADFVTFKRTAEEVFIRLYHCKGSDGASAGERVEDMYEVCGQAIKSINWLDNQTLLDKINYRERSRNGASHYIKGDKALLKDIINSARALHTKYEVVVVQPGLAHSKLSEKAASLLAAANDYIIKAPCEGLRIIASA